MEDLGIINKKLSIYLLKCEKQLDDALVENEKYKLLLSYHGCSGKFVKKSVRDLVNELAHANSKIRKLTNEFITLKNGGGFEGNNHGMSLQSAHEFMTDKNKASSNKNKTSSNKNHEEYEKILLNFLRKNPRSSYREIKSRLNIPKSWFYDFVCGDNIKIERCEKNRKIILYSLIK